MKAQLCQLCGRETFRADGVCRGCEPLPAFPSGTYRCCGGFAEHFESCLIGEAIAHARKFVAAARARRPLEEAVAEAPHLRVIR